MKSRELVPAGALPREHNERNALLITYVLYGLGYLVLLTTVAGVIINHVKMRDLARGSLNWTHHRWLLRTFWFGIFWSLVCLLLTPVMIGFFGYAILWLWCAYRFIRGAVTFADQRPMPW